MISRTRRTWLWRGNGLTIHQVERESDHGKSPLQPGQEVYEETLLLEMSH